ncbi:MAG: hypothetical protein GY759_11245 [Chloroflexi bacterium]|nr:hypothetical protein [Chloroflexota bacterium]
MAEESGQAQGHTQPDAIPQPQPEPRPDTLRQGEGTLQGPEHADDKQGLGHEHGAVEDEVGVEGGEEGK